MIKMLVANIATNGMLAGVLVAFQVLPEDVNGLLWWMFLGMLSVVGTLVIYIRTLWTKNDQIRDKHDQLRDRLIEAEKEKTAFAVDMVNQYQETNQASTTAIDKVTEGLKELGSAQETIQLLKQMAGSQ